MSVRGVALVGIIVWLGTLSVMAQVDTPENQENLNQQKIAELKRKLDELADETTELESTTEEPGLERLTRIEKQLDHLLEVVTDIQEKQKAIQQQQVDYQELRNLIEALSENSNTAKNNSTAKLAKKQVAMDGEFYVVLESQRTLEQAKRAKQMLSSSDTKVIILEGSQRNWYYLALPQQLEYKPAITLLNEARADGFSEAWWIRADEVKML